MSLVALKGKFGGLLQSLNGSTTSNFSTILESGYEALVLASVMIEYKRIHGNISNLIHPTHRDFLKQKPGKFELGRSFKIEFSTGLSFYFGADVEVYGIEALKARRPSGGLFEVDVAVVPENVASEVTTRFNGYPGPQHLDSVYECKFGKYYKGQLRELMGLKRHLSLLRGDDATLRPIDPSQLFSFETRNSMPSIPLKMVRPLRLRFLNRTTANLYDLDQVIIT